MKHGAVLVGRGVHVAWSAGVLVGLALPVLWGCGNQTLLPVSGKVLHKDGKPVTSGLVIFEPVAAKTSARGEIHSDILAFALRAFAED